MFNGERLYQALAATHPLLGESQYAGGPFCFETFPHAVTCAMLGTDVASAKQKYQLRATSIVRFAIRLSCSPFHEHRSLGFLVRQ
jgi:hypothetical protein